MERIRQMTDTRRCALLWAATILLTAALLFLCGGKVHAWEGDDDWMRDTFSRYTMAAMLSGQEENYFNDSEKPDALTVLNYTAYRLAIQVQSHLIRSMRTMFVRTFQQL